MFITATTRGTSQLVTQGLEGVPNDWDNHMFYIYYLLETGKKKN